MTEEKETALATFSEVDACTVSDALDALKLDGSVLGLSALWAGARAVGRAVTVRLVEGPAPAGRPPVHLGARALDMAGPGDVIVVDNGGRIGMGAWGGLLATAASVRGVAGVVVDGACRDVDEARELRFPVFALAPVLRTARGRVHEESTGDPVELGGVRVAPGDLVVADGSGVVVVAQAHAEEVAATVRRIADREQRMAEDLRRGMRPSEVLGGSYEHMLGGGR